MSFPVRNFQFSQWARCRLVGKGKLCGSETATEQGRGGFYGGLQRIELPVALHTSKAAEGKAERPREVSQGS